MIIMTVTFETELTEDELLAVARGRSDAFRAIPGLIQKYYVRLSEPSFTATTASASVR